LLLSIVIVSHNARELLAACLASLDEHLRGVEHEVCVVDNASTDGSADLVREQFPRVRLLVEPRNRGFAAAVNAAMEATSGRYVCWLNPDARLLGGGMSEVLEYLEAHERVGIAGPQLVNADGSVQHSFRSFPSYATALFNRNSLLTRLFPRNRFTRRYLLTDLDRNAVQETDWVSGACLIHRRALGTLDDRFFLYMEDIDFCLRARAAGWGIVYHPALRVLHHIGGSSRRVPVRRVVALHRSIWRYYAKHFRRNPLLDAASAAVIWGRCLLMMTEALLFGARDPRRIRGA
jgi:N-acetylglucosaminyl-diphospho-decaprenol L-rhamnosyltransferase